MTTRITPLSFYDLSDEMQRKLDRHLLRSDQVLVKLYKTASVHSNFRQYVRAIVKIDQEHERRIFWYEPRQCWQFCREDDDPFRAPYCPTPDMSMRF